MSEFKQEQLDSIDMNRLRGAVKLLNDTGLLTEKIKVAGLTKEALSEKFMTSVEDLAQQDGIEFPEKMIVFYNILAGMMEEGTVFTEPDVPAPEVPETKTEDPTPAAETKKKAGRPPSAKKAEEKPKVPKVTKVPSFDELKKRLETPGSPTAGFDKLCLKGGKPEDLIALMVKLYPDFKVLKTKSNISGHIRYRELTGYLYEKREDGFVKLIGFKSKS